MNRFNRISDAIRTATGIEVSVFSTSEIESLRPRIAAELAKNDLAMDENQVYFTFFASTSGFVGVFDRRGDEDWNYARLFRQMLVHSMSDPFESMTDDEKIRLLLRGELSEEKAEAVKNSIKPSSNQVYYALALVCGAKNKRVELEEYVENVKEKDDYSLSLNETTVIYLKKAVSGYESAVDFARILYDSIKEELLIDLTVAVAGEIRSFEDFAVSYKKELTAIRYGRLLFPKERVYYYKDFALAQILTKVPKTELASAYGSMVGAGDARVWEDEELIETAEAFVRCSLNVSETSRLMNIHRNTLMYRLDKIKRETGYDLRKFEDAASFNLIDLIRKTLALDV